MELHADCKVDVLIRTFNSGQTLETCLKSVVKHIPYSRILIADHFSTDETRKIGESFNVEIISEDIGLGYATKLLISKARTEYLLFVDSDVEVARDGFVEEAIKLLGKGRTGAVVGCALGHGFLFGIPLGLTIMGTKFASTVSMPDKVQGRETFYFEEALRRNHLKVAYISDAMIHRSTYRQVSYWPEWQGAQIRLTPSRHLGQLLNAIAVVFMMHLNSKSVKNFLYSPIYYLKILRGYCHPEKYGKMDRRKAGLYLEKEAGKPE